MKHRPGFTIVEIVVVIAVIAILATVATVSYTGLQVRARDNERIADVETMQSALEGFYEQHGRYPGLVADELLDQPGFYDETLRLPSASLVSPSAAAGTTFSWQWNATPTVSTYSLTSYENTGSTLCTGSNPCTRYVIRWLKEADGSVQTATSKFGN